MASYKKTYEGDYKKSYKIYSEWKAESAAKRKDYQTISKRIESKYNKIERSNHYEITGNLLKESERVLADGRRLKHKEEFQKNEKSFHKVPPINESQSRSVIQKIPKKTLNEKVLVEPVQVEDIIDDGNYNYFDYPIKQTGIDKFLNLKTNKILNTNEAREVLKMAGYIPQISSSIGLIIFLFILANIIFPMVAPLIAFIYGIYRFASTNTTWIKQTPNRTLKYSLRASNTEININKNIGRACIVIGIFAALIRYKNFLDLI